MHEKGQKPDLITLSEELRSRGSLERVGGSAYIASLASFTPSAANVEYYAKIVQEMATRRRLIHLSSEIAAVAHEETNNVDQILDELQAKIFEISQNRKTAEYHSAKEIVTETMLLIEKLSTNPEAFTGVPSGLTDLDALTSGLQNSEFIVIGARPSVGKTALALTIAAHASIDLKIPTAFFRWRCRNRRLCSGSYPPRRESLPSEYVRGESEPRITTASWKPLQGYMRLLSILWTCRT